MTTVGILHPGSMGAAVAAQAKRNATVLWCGEGRSRATADRATRSGLTAASDLADLVSRSEIILSICPPAHAEEVAQTVAALSFTGVYVEGNAVSPETMSRIAKLIERPGATVVDGAVVGSPPSPSKVARLLLAGRADAVAAVERVFRGTQVRPLVLPGGMGSASALKLAYSSYQKTSRVLALVAYAFAAEHGVEQFLLDIARIRSGSYLAEPDYFPKVAARAWRWAPELRETAQALSAQNLPKEVVESAADILERLRTFRDGSPQVDEVLERLRSPRPSGPHPDGGIRVGEQQAGA
ncbi:MAG: NAD(P)-dependent oxidoreductase [Frankia sp.]|nr:NAD(P)-dependent oxidoreductase [Frankia sp.]